MQKEAEVTEKTAVAEEKFSFIQLCEMELPAQKKNKALNGQLCLF